MSQNRKFSKFLNGCCSTGGRGLDQEINRRRRRELSEAERADMSLHNDECAAKSCHIYKGMWRRGIRPNQKIRITVTSIM